MRHVTQLERQQESGADKHEHEKQRGKGARAAIASLFIDSERRTLRARTLRRRSALGRLANHSKMRTSGHSDAAHKPVIRQVRLRRPPCRDDNPRSRVR